MPRRQLRAQWPCGIAEVLGSMAKSRALANAPDAGAGRHAGMHERRTGAGQIACARSHRRTCVSADRRRLITHLLELLPHAVAVGAGPVDPQTARAAGEVLLRREDVRRYLVCHRGFEHSDHGCVTRYATGEEGRERIEGACMDDLTQLLTEVVAADEDDGEPTSQARHAVVSRQYRPALGASVSYQAASAEVRTISGILPNQSQPRGEATEHRVDSKASGAHLMPAYTIRGT